MANVINLRGEPIIDEQLDAEVEIMPGSLVEVNPSTEKLRLQSTAGGPAEALFALERDELGNDIDTAYAIGDRVKVGRYAPGMGVLAFIPSGQNITKGSTLEPAGSGNLRVLASGTPIARADEDSGAVTERTRIKVVII